MGDLRELFADVADGPAPQTRLEAGELFAAGRRRRRRQRWSAMAAVGAVLAGIGVAGLIRTPEPDEAVPTATGAVVAVTAGDRDHLYALRPACPEPDCRTRVTVLASSDGGREWTERAEVRLSAMVATGPDTLLGMKPDVERTLLLSTDGGNRWSEVRESPGGPAAGDTLTICRPRETPGGCRLERVDLLAGTTTPLRNTPPTVATGGLDAVVDGRMAGTFYLAGLDRGTGGPSIAGTFDGGRSWTTIAFPVDACTGACEPPIATAGPDGTAYLTANGEACRVFGGNGKAQSIRGEPVWSYVTADGTHVIALADGSYLAGREGETYRDWRPQGLPDRVEPVRRTPDGWYYTVDAAQGRWYGSRDGVTWN